MKEFIKGCAWFAMWLYFSIALIGQLARFIPKDGKDDTDPPHDRSGLLLRTDALTGCQYVAVPFSGMSPRLDKNGKQVCK